MSRSPSARAAHYRGVPQIHLYALVILGVGFVFIFSYQSEIGGWRRQGYRTLEVPAKCESDSHKKMSILKRGGHSDAEVDTETTWSRNLGIKSTLTQSDSHTSRITSTRKAAPPPPPKKVHWKDLKVEAYIPPVDSVHSNTVSSNFQLVIKVLALNNYASLVRCLSSLAKAEYTGDSVDIHIYIDHFEISEAVRRLESRRLLTEEIETETSSEEGLGEVEEGTENTAALETVEEEIQKTALETFDGDIQRTALETVDEETQRTALETVDEETQRTALETVDEETQRTASETVDEEIQRNSLETVDEETQRTASETVDEETQRTASETVDEEIQRTALETVDEEIQRAALETVDEDIQKTEDERTDSTSTEQEVGDEDESAAMHVPDRVETGVDSVESSDWGLVEERLSDARQVLNYTESFLWKHGKKVIHYSTKRAGSQSQWLDAWWPSSDDEFALFLEDDAELSPLYYRYARSLIATYYYQPNYFDPSLYGISLQRAQIVPGKNGRPLKVSKRTRLFMYQMVGMWGQIFFPKPWKEFRMWYDSQKSHHVKPVVDGMVTTDWYQEHGEKMFTPWFVKFAYSQGYFNLHTNFLRDRVLSVTHRDVGEKKSKKYSGCDSVLLWQNGTYDIDLWHMAATWHIKRYDYCFKRVKVGRFANYSSDVPGLLDSIVSQESKQILMVSTIGVPEVLVKNWLCRVRNLGIENYVLLGEDPEFLEDLARRGHATMRIKDKAIWRKNIEKEVTAVSDVLNLGYDVWFTRADSIWVGNPLTLAPTEGADVIGLEKSPVNLFFLRSSTETTRLWASVDEDLYKGDGLWETVSEKFIQRCEEEKNMQMRKLDEVVFINGEELSQAPTLENGGGCADAQVVVLTGYRSLEDYEIKAKVAQLDLWNLDDDQACARLVC